MSDRPKAGRVWIIGSPWAFVKIGRLFPDLRPTPEQPPNPGPLQSSPPPSQYRERK